MKFKFGALAAAAVSLLAASGAQANFILGNSSSSGNSSAAFVAIDNGGNISLAVDLNTQLANFLPASSLTFAAGNLSAPGTRAVWNFAANTFTINGVAVAAGTGMSYSWASQVSGFLGNSNVTGNGYQWGVIAADSVVSVNGNQNVTASNVVKGQNVLYTGASPDFDNSIASGTTAGSIANSASNVTEFYAPNANTGTNSPTVKGASTATSGTPFLGYTLANGNVGDFGGGQQGMNNFLVDPGTVSYFSWANATNPTTLMSLGGTVTTGALSPTPSTFTWNAANSTLTYVVPVPEPSTYALWMAGLAGLGFIVRRRSAR